MNKIEVKKLIELGFLESNNICSIYGQEVLDNFVKLLFDKLSKEGFKHYNIDFINNKIKGKFYRIVNNTLELMIFNENVQNDSLDLQYLFSKFLKDTLGIALIEGSRAYNGYNYYLGYILIKDLKKIYEIKQNNEKTYLKFNLFNIFYSVLKEDSYLSYKIAPSLAIVPLHQNKSGVLSYANNIKENLYFNTYIDDRNISPLEKKKYAISKRVPIVIYVGPKEYKNKKLTIEINNVKEEISIEELDLINNYLIRTLKDKYNENLKNIYQYEKEIIVMRELKKIVKVNICSNCKIEKYKYFLTPFNRVSKNNRCLVCNQYCNNIVLMKKK